MCDIETPVTIIAFLIIFLSGFGWGQWYSERSIRAEEKKTETGRIKISMPADPEEAAALMKVLGEVMEQVRRDAEDSKGIKKCSN